MREEEKKPDNLCQAAAYGVLLILGPVGWLAIVLHQLYKHRQSTSSDRAHRRLLKERDKALHRLEAEKRKTAAAEEIRRIARKKIADKEWEDKQKRYEEEEAKKPPPPTLKQRLAMIDDYFIELKDQLERSTSDPATLRAIIRDLDQKKRNAIKRCIEVNL